MIVAILSVLGTCLLQPPADPSDLIKSIERQQGGRHWIDQPTEPPKSPEESLTCLQIEPGYRIELAAAEPLITDPVAIDFDHLGRMFVVEYTDYPVGPKDPAALPLSQVVLLEDVDHDGRMDKRTVFAPHLKFCHSLMAFRDGILASTDTWFRPASLATGPDGALYVADMYRLWVEHPKFVPDDVAAKMDWRAGEDRGRVWRIVREDAAAVMPFSPPVFTDDLVKLLQDGNGWRRMLGQRLIVENHRLATKCHRAT